MMIEISNYENAKKVEKFMEENKIEFEYLDSDRYLTSCPHCGDSEFMHDGKCHHCGESY